MIFGGLYSFFVHVKSLQSSKVHAKGSYSVQRCSCLNCLKCLMSSPGFTCDSELGFSAFRVFQTQTDRVSSSVQYENMFLSKACKPILANT